MIDELKKAHARELGNHIQEHNRKYNELLKDKLNMEDQMKAQFEAEKAALIKEWEKKLKDAVDRARREEQERAKGEMEKVRATHESQIEILEGKIKRLEQEVADANKKIKERESTIAERDSTIG